MKKIWTNLLILSLGFSLAACSSNTQQQNTGLGIATGAVAGGLLGSLVGGGTGQIVAIGAGAILGGVIGGNIGSSMDSSDSYHVNAALGGPVDHVTYWTNPRTGVTYRVVPVSGPIMVRGYRHCRRYRTTAIINGRTRHVYGTACRRPDGRWVAVMSH